MKKLLYISLAAFIALFAISCNKDEPSSSLKVTFRKANIAGAKMIALASGPVATKAEGDVNIGPKALYTVSEDGTLVQVAYNVEVEGAKGEIAEFIKANLIISPGFVFPVGDGWIWLANCFLAYPGDWAALPNGPEKNALSKIKNDFSEAHHESHGAHYLIRKSDGALFEWTIEAGAPDGMDDGFKQPTFLNGWFHQLGKDLFVKVDGWGGMSVNAGKLFRLQDKGSTLDAVNILGDNIGCGNLWPADGYFGVNFHYDGASPLGILAPPSFEPILLQQDPGFDKEMYMLSIAKKLYLAVNCVTELYIDDGKEKYYYGDDYSTEIYNLVINGNSITRGNLICTVDHWMNINQEGNSFISSGETLSWWKDSKIYTFDPKAGKVTSRALPEHYPVNRIYASTLKRAAQTAEHLSDKTGIMITFDPDLMEFNNGLLAGLSREEAAKLYPTVKDLPVDQAVYGQESQAEFRSRAVKALDRVFAENEPEAVVAVVSHGGMINQLYGAFLHTPLGEDSFICTSDTGIHVWKTTDHGNYVIRANLDGHVQGI